MIMSGMSYGTLVGLHTILSGKHDFSGVVLVAPALLVEMTAIYEFKHVCKTIEQLVPKARIVPDRSAHSEEPVTARMGAETLKP
ncbi:hypothetical protein Plhal304r1_c091g0171761 [Plasmopara halstedii]